MGHVQIPFRFAFLWCSFCHEIILIGASLHSLELDSTHIKRLVADTMTVKQNIGLRAGFVSEGGVRLSGVTCGSILSCQGGTFINPGSVALHIQGMRVGFTVFLNKGFLALGEVRATGLSTGADLDCIFGLFINPTGLAINADKASVSGTVALSEGFVAVGEVRFNGGTIGAGLDCHYGSFINPNGAALNLYSATIKGDLLLVGNPKIEGELHFHGATISGSLKMLSIHQPEKVKLTLDSARAQTLHDEEKSWVNKNNLSLHEFEYKYIHKESPKDYVSRLKWLQLQLDQPYNPQPYEQLAKVLRESGYDQDGKEILIAKERVRGSWAKMDWLGKVWHKILGYTITYGYKPLKASLWIAFFVFLGTLLFGLGKSDLISQINPSISPPAFNAFIYSLDTFLPIINFQQEASWTPDSSKSTSISIPKVDVSGLISIDAWTLNIDGSWLLGYLWFHIAAGWFLTTLFVVGFTGLVRR